MAESQSFKCLVVTPEETAVEQDVSFVALPLFDGELGVAAHHAPMIGRLGCGELRLVGLDATVTRFFVDGGFVQVVDNVVSVMTNHAVPASRLRTEDAAQQLDANLAMTANSEESWEAREKAVAQSRAQLRIARK